MAMLAVSITFAALDFHWAFNRWLVLLFVLAAGALVVYLYKAQQRIASRRAIIALTTLRVLLMALVLVLLAGPVYQWRHNAESGGTLYVVLDQSRSMAYADRQATAVERLRWADALGLVPSDARPDKLDRWVAALEALRDEWTYLKGRSELAAEGSEAAERVQQLVEDLGRWNRGLQEVIGGVERGTGADGKGGVEAVLVSLREASDLVEKGSAKARGRARPEEASADVEWQAVSQRLDSAVANLRPVADDEDRAFLAARGNDPAIKEALAKVAGMSRAQILVASLTEKSKHGRVGLPDVLPRQDVRVVGFADGPQLVPADEPAEIAHLLKTSFAPAGFSTNLAAALGWVQQQVGQDQPASVLVISDGRQNIGGDLIEPARLLAARGVRVFTLAVGSDEAVADATVEQIDAPDWVYQDDVVKGDALLRLDGLANKPVTVEIRRRGGTGTSAEEKLVETKTVTPGQRRDTKRISFQDKPLGPGVYEYEVRAVELPDEAVKDNNRQTVRVSVKKDKLNVLLVEEQPRWEYRYLANYLERDQRVKLQAVLLQPAQVEQVVRPAPVRASPYNKQTLVDLMPDSKEGWAAFDLIILGDVPPEALTEQHQEWVASAVRDRGAAVVLMAGPFNLPQRYGRLREVATNPSGPLGEGKSVYDLLPVYPESAWPPDELAAHVKKGFMPTVAPEGRASVLSQFSVDEKYNAQLWSMLPPWYWHSQQTRAKPGASVVWMIGEAGSNTPDPAAASRRALLATMQFGAGRVMYLAAEQTWRLRQVNGENLHERFWGQVIRWAAGSDLPAGGRFARFGTDKPRYVGGEPVRVMARLLDRDQLAPLTARTDVKVVARHGPDKVVGEATLTEAADTPGLYHAELAGLPAGAAELSLQGGPVEKLLADDPSVAHKTLTVDVQTRANLEQRNINADRATLARVARAGGGIALDAAYADVLAGHLPELNYRTERVEQFGLFADPGGRGTRKAHWLFLGLFVTLITAEWVIRKAAGLV